MGSTLQMTPTQVSEEEEACLFAGQLASASVLPMVLKASIELDLLEIMAKAGPGAFLSPSEIASQLPTSNPDAPAMLDRMLRLLASYSILTYSSRDLPDGRVERLYGLGLVCKFLTKNQDECSYDGHVLLGQDKVIMESWYHLKDAVLEGGIPFKKAHGVTIFDYQGTDPRFDKVCNSVQSNHSAVTMKKILKFYKGFEGLNSVVDVGGGTGAIMRVIVSTYPSIKAINFDLPHVIEKAPKYPGVEYAGGDMFVSVPKGDAIFIKSIFQNWSDEHCLKLLNNCYVSLPENGKVIVADCMIPETLDYSLATKGIIHADILMLAQTPSGRERTEKEFEALAKGAGFRGFRIVGTVLSTYVMEFLKKP